MTRHLTRSGGASSDSRREPVLLVEWASSGGCWVDGEPFRRSNRFLRQGLAMTKAFGEDLVRAGYPVTFLCDSRHPVEPVPSCAHRVEVGSAPQFWRAMRREAANVRWIMLVAPEESGWLQRCHAHLGRYRDKFLGPVGRFVAIAGSKQATSRCLERAGVQDLPGQVWVAQQTSWPPDFPVPAMVKPDQGAGGACTLVRNWRRFRPPTGGAWRLEKYVPGHSVSMVVMRGRRQTLFCEPATQVFSAGRTRHYRGGEFPLPPAWRLRTHRLARRGLDALGEFRGLVGLDLVLHESDPRQDVIVDVNPRLVCSYLGLRQIYATNLADALIRLVAGENVLLQRLRGFGSFRV